MKIEISSTHCVDVADGRVVTGQNGLICSASCAKQAYGESQNFYVVNHPVHGVIAVSANEFHELQLPSLKAS